MQHRASVVLVIEDEPNITRVIRASLTDREVEFVSALDGVRGLQLMREVRPVVVLLDLALPGIDGWEVLTRIRADEDLAGIPVVIVTAQGDSATAVKARRLGANGFVAKPFRPSDVRRAVDCYLTPCEAESA